jgi:hypothetical protein
MDGTYGAKHEQTSPLLHYHITVNRDDAQLPGPAEFGVASERAAASRSVSIMSAQTAEKIISVITVPIMDKQAASLLSRARGRL